MEAAKAAVVEAVKAAVSEVAKLAAKAVPIEAAKAAAKSANLVLLPPAPVGAATGDSARTRAAYLTRICVTGKFEFFCIQQLFHCIISF